MPAALFQVAIVAQRAFALGHLDLVAGPREYWRERQPRDTAAHDQYALSVHVGPRIRASRSDRPGGLTAPSGRCDVRGDVL